MKKLRLFKLRYNILFRRFFLNLMLLAMSPRNKMVIMLSQNLDKHIVLYQKKLFIKYSLKSVDIIG
jgi:hypothetical protein